MPSCRITNYTTQPINVALKHLCALHFENGIAPGQTVKLKPGRVWFTLEVLVDDEKNRYSAAQSAAAIAAVSLACVGSAALAVPAAAAIGGATAGATIGGAISAGVGHIVAAGGTAINAVLAAGSSTVGSVVLAGAAGLMTAENTLGATLVAAQGFVAANAGGAAALSTTLLPKAIRVVEQEVGGFTQVQKEIIAILSSPTVSQDVRAEGLSILERLTTAYAADREWAAQQQIEQGEQEEEEDDDTVQDGPAAKPRSKLSLKRVQTASSVLANVVSLKNSFDKRKTPRRAATEPSTIGEEEEEVDMSGEQVSEDEATSKPKKKLDKKAAKAAKKKAKLEAKDAKEWENLEFDAEEAYGEGAGENRMLSTKEFLRVYGLYMGERRHYEIHENEGKLVLVDANTQEEIKSGK